MKLYVGNLPWTIKDAELEEMFREFGDVKSSSVIMDRENPSRSRGFGFVELDHADAVKAIEKMNGHDVQGRPLRVNEAQERTRS